MWFAEKMLNLDHEDNPVVVATLSVPPGTYYVNVTGDAFNVFDGDADLWCRRSRQNIK